MNDPEVPAFFRRLWRLQEPPSRLGRKSTLDVETVIATAVRLADEGGLETATLANIAAELQVTPMSLYRYVGSKQELLQLMIDAASFPPDRHEGLAGWRSRLREWCNDLWALYQNRTWTPHVPIYRAPSGPNQMAWLERGLEALDGTGLDPNDALAAVSLLSGYVRQSALLAAELGAGSSDGTSPVDATYTEALGKLVTADRFPHIAAMFASTTINSADSAERESHNDFHAGLEVILDGIATRVASAPDE